MSTADATQRATPFRFDVLIERWVNAERVLVNMPEHERQRHFDMSMWGKRTECGTVACAAGQCGLDPWFRERGFKLDFDEDGHPDISNVPEFFGLEGSSRIFYDSRRRFVDIVINEISAHISHLTEVARLSATAPVAIDEMWPGEGGIYAGAVLDEEDGPHHLILGPEHDGGLDWRNSVLYAAELQVDACRDFALASPTQGLVLFDRMRRHFAPDCYWLRKQHESYPGDAWGQNFGNGSQGYWFKGGQLRARAVRRLPI